MDASSALAGPPQREKLMTHWAMCAAPADPSLEAAAPQSHWIAIASPQPVAAALRELGQWSLDGPATAFDAQDWWYRLPVRPAARRCARKNRAGF